MPTDTEVRCFHDIKAENERLKAALQSVVGIANETWALWDSDQDHKVGKILKALAGHLPRYRSDIDDIHEALKGTTYAH